MALDFWYVTVMLHDLAYGGSEEGGWYFDTYEKQDSELNKRFLFERSALRHQKQIEEKIEAMNEGRPDITSVISEGRYMTIVTKGQPEDNYPRMKPRYE